MFYPIPLTTYTSFTLIFFFTQSSAALTGCPKVLQEASDLYQLSTVFMATPEHQQQNEEMERYTDNILNFSLSLSFLKNQTT